MLPADQRTIIEETYQELSQNLDAAGQLFYQRLFELDPSLRLLFKTSSMEQGRKLMQTVGLVVAGMHMPEILALALRELGQRHTRYGVKPEFYETVGEALFWTLQETLGSRYTHAANIAWRALYRHIVAMVEPA